MSQAAAGPGGRSSHGLQKVAESYLGAPYRWGGMNRTGMDCSGFIKKVYAEVFSITLPHSSAKIAKLGRAVSRKKLRQGDIVLFGSILGIHHAGIYMNDNKFIHASTTAGVVYSSLHESYYRKKYKGARRVIENEY
jgi:cell wall-associated NlpC family hydrolase